MYFCIRDDDTSFFTSPEDLERVYGEVSQWGPISLAVVPFHRAGTSGVVPEKCRRRWSVHPLHENRPLVDYLRMGVAQGRFEIMLHGYHHDELYDRWEFAGGHDLAQRVTHGRQYLEDLLGATIRVFVPPYNSINRQGLRAIARAGLHLAGTRGVRSGWPLLSRKTWVLWSRLRRWRTSGGLGIPWIWSSETTARFLAMLSRLHQECNTTRRSSRARWLWAERSASPPTTGSKPLPASTLVTQA